MERRAPRPGQLRIHRVHPQRRKLTGRFAIETDEELGAIIYGNYDYSAGDWQHRYIVTDFSKTQMIWTAKDDRSDISVYERCDGIPEDITGGKTE